MTSVLVVDDDAPLRKALGRELSAAGYEPGLAASYAEALERLEERRYQVLLTDLRMQGPDGLSLIRAVTGTFPSTRPILMSAYASARDSKHALDLGAVRVLCKPFDSSEMLAAVQKAAECADGFSGSVHGLSLLDVLQMFHQAQRSVSIVVLGGVPAAIHMQNGEVVHATCGEVSGELAFDQILALPSGSLETSSLCAVTRSVFRPFQGLVLDALRRFDERKSGRPRASSIPSPPSSRPEPACGLLDDLCRRAVLGLGGDLGCSVIRLCDGTVLGRYATSAGARDRGREFSATACELYESFARSAVDHFADVTAPAPFRVEIERDDGFYLARSTRGGDRALTLVATGRPQTAALRRQLDAMMPLLEALVPAC